MYGYAGKILRVDLTRGECTVEDLDPELAKKFVGGRGLATKILFDEVDAAVAPLSSENKLIFATGACTGTGALGASKYMVVTKSPLTGAIACSNSGGFFASALKFAGYDLIIFEGKAEKPVYLSIVDDVVELRPASHLWGKSTDEVERILRDEIGNHWQARETRIACIGPAGEKLVRFASIINDKYRAAGRSGVGAVAGSKNLKAVAVRGTKGLMIADVERFREGLFSVLDSDKKSPATSLESAISLHNQGTARAVTMVADIGALPVRNFQEGVVKDVARISGATLRETLFRKAISCFSCPIACARWTTVNIPGFEGEGEGPEWETIGLFGGSGGVSSLPHITKAHYICNELGMDTIEMGSAIACAMELFEKGFLPEEEAGFKLNFGNAEATVELVRRTGLREGFGDVLAEGGYRMAEKYGHPELFMGVKKQGFAAYDPRAIKGRGLGYVTSNRGACHMKGMVHMSEFSDPLPIEGKAAKLKWWEELMAVYDSAGFCFWNLRGIDIDKAPAVALSMLEAVTSAGYDMESMFRTGERIWNLERLFNLKAGLTKKDDTLPRRMLEEPMPNGPAKGHVHELEVMLAEYYQLRGWDENGVPTAEKLAELELA